MWIIPNSTKNNPFDESDLIKPEGYPKTKSPIGDTLTIDVTDWSGRESAEYDACYIEVELIVKPLFVEINGPYVVHDPLTTWTAVASGGVPPYQYSWEVRVRYKETGWHDFYFYGEGPTKGFPFGPGIDEIEWKVTVTDENNNTAEATKYVEYVPES